MSRASIKDERILDALLISPSISAAANMVGVERKTIYARLDDSAFKKRFDALRREQIKNASRYLQAQIQSAIDTTVSIMNDTSANAMVRLTAARTILEYVGKCVEQEQIIERIEALEGEFDNETKL